MGNTSSERAGLERHGHKASRADGAGGAGGTKDGDRPKILMDSPEDADLFHSEEMKVGLPLAFGCLGNAGTASRLYPFNRSAPSSFPSLMLLQSPVLFHLSVIFHVRRSLRCFFCSL